MGELYAHGCGACGSVPIADDNNPDEEGILTINYVGSNDGCAGNRICDPTIKANSTNNPFNAGQNPTPADALVVTSTVAGNATTLPTGSPVNGIPSAPVPVSLGDVVGSQPVSPSSSIPSEDPTIFYGESGVQCPQC